MEQTWDRNLNGWVGDVAPRRARERVIQSPPSDQRTNPEMDMSECKKNIASDLATTGVGFRLVSGPSRRGKMQRESIPIPMAI